ncbi:MAG: TIGR03084 family metal-binding protein [Steroidobacteraceae bacterium]
MREVCAALRAECEELDALVSALNAGQWQRKTIFYNWSVYDEIAHNYFLDRLALMSIEQPGEFAVIAERVARDEKDPDYSFRAYTNEVLGILARDELLQRWRENYRHMIAVFEASDPRQRMKWFGPDMAVKSCATARQMETWAHGQDIYDLLRIRRTNTDRIINIVNLGVRTYGWSFLNRGFEPPVPPPYVELSAPSGATWTFNDPDAPASVRGTAEDFCWVVTQRRNVADTQLEVRGDAAVRWMQIAQCFAGAPATGPAPGVRQVAWERTRPAQASPERST